MAAAAAVNLRRSEHNMDFFTEAEFRDTEFYHGWFRPRGWLYTSSIILDSTETERAYLVAVRPPNHPFTEKEIAILKKHAPHFAQATRIQKMVMEIKNPNRRFGALEMSVLAILKLSLAESFITIALYQGQSVKEYAHSAGLTIDSARTYVKNIYKKLGVHSRGEFMRRLQDLFRQ